MKLMRQGDHQFFKKFYRMSPATFDKLHELVQADSQRMHCIREPLASEERIASTLSYLASGQDVKDVALAYRVGLETARVAVHETCRALGARLCPIYMKIELGNGFSRRWQFPNCLGAVDGKHVAITCPKDSGSAYYNYKASDFGQALENGTLNLPDLGKLPRCQDPRLAPHVFVGDEALQLRPDFLRPYPPKDLTEERRVFNYWLSQGRYAQITSCVRKRRRWWWLVKPAENADLCVTRCPTHHNAAGGLIQAGPANAEGPVPFRLEVAVGLELPA
ncbi:hypothetical protein HPB47_015793 [Ixodes persulcatus]|uniref:Uncharacterized protein n=1 Tax=Ixodes persulcatus TaxID=34615 RepID=A0AC60QSI2_IXOPE|nr:hypothetical protein HPB47_015793 [Ixodes persulcatus]